MKREVKENVIPKTQFPLSLNETEWPPGKAAKEELPGPCPFREKFTKTSWLGINDITLKHGQLINVKILNSHGLYASLWQRWGNGVNKRGVDLTLRVD